MKNERRGHLYLRDSKVMDSNQSSPNLLLIERNLQAARGGTGRRKRQAKWIFHRGKEKRWIQNMYMDRREGWWYGRRRNILRRKEQESSIVIIKRVKVVIMQMGKTLQLEVSKRWIYMEWCVQKAWQRERNVIFSWTFVHVPHHYRYHRYSFLFSSASSLSWNSTVVACKLSRTPFRVVI